jgi:hypothetical protein
MNRNTSYLEVNNKLIEVQYHLKHTVARKENIQDLEIANICCCQWKKTPVKGKHNSEKERFRGRTVMHQLVRTSYLEVNNKLIEVEYHLKHTVARMENIQDLEIANTSRCH